MLTVIRFQNTSQRNRYKVENLPARIFEIDSLFHARFVSLFCIVVFVIANVSCSVLGCSFGKVFLFNAVTNYVGTHAEHVRL